MSAVSTRTKAEWDAYQKQRALEMMRVIIKLIEKGKVKVVSHDFWSHGDDGDTTFRLDIKGNS